MIVSIAIARERILETGINEAQVIWSLTKVEITITLPSTNFWGWSWYHLTAAKICSFSSTVASSALLEGNAEEVLIAGVWTKQYSTTPTLTSSILGSLEVRIPERRPNSNNHRWSTGPGSNRCVCLFKSLDLTELCIMERNMADFFRTIKGNIHVLERVSVNFWQISLAQVKPHDGKGALWHKYSPNDTACSFCTLKQRDYQWQGQEEQFHAHLLFVSNWPVEVESLEEEYQLLGFEGWRTYVLLAGALGHSMTSAFSQVFHCNVQMRNTRKSIKDSHQIYTPLGDSAYVGSGYKLHIIVEIQYKN